MGTISGKIISNLGKTYYKVQEKVVETVLNSLDYKMKYAVGLE